MFSTQGQNAIPRIRRIVPYDLRITEIAMGRILDDRILLILGECHTAVRTIGNTLLFVVTV